MSRSATPSTTAGVTSADAGAPKVIALGLRSADESVRQAAQELMDLLGEQGVVDMDEQVSKASRELDLPG